MNDQLNINLHVEGEPTWSLKVTSTWNPRTMSFMPTPTEDEKKAYPYTTNNCLRHFRGRYALTDAVLYLAELLGEPIAHKIRKVG